MKTILQLVSFAGLILTVLPSFMVFLQTISWQTHATLMALGTLMWFLSAPFWMKKAEES